MSETELPRAVSAGAAPTLRDDDRGHGRPARPRQERLVVTALFDTADAVDAAVRGLQVAGVPRDTVEVIVSRAASDRFYAGRARPPGHEMFRWAGIGGITGLLVGAAISFIILALPEDVGPGPAAIAQLVGPNLSTVLGAVLGGLFGRMRRRRPNPWYARAAESPESIVLAVRAGDEEEARDIAQLLTDGGGREPRTAPRSGRRP